MNVRFRQSCLVATLLFLVLPACSRSQLGVDSHPWMKAYTVVLDHPFAGVSDENGELSIENLPVGDKLVFRTFHESGTFKEILIDGERQQ